MPTDQPSTDSPLRKLTTQEFIDIITLKDEERYADFYRLWNDEKVIVIHDVELTEDIYINDSDIISLQLVIESGLFKSIIIKGGTFKYIFRILGGTFYQVMIQGGIFESFFLIQGGTFNFHFWIEGGTFKNGFNIKKGTFDFLFIVKGGIFENKFEVEGGTFNHLFIIEGGTFKNLFVIQGGTFEDLFMIKNITFENGFWIYGGTFKDNFSILTVISEGRFGISGGTFENRFDIAGSTFKDPFEILGGTFKNNVWLSESIFVSYVSIRAGYFDKKILIRNGYMFSLSVRDVISKIELEIFSTSQINALSLSGTLPKDSLIQISTSLYQLSFNNVQNFGTIILNGFSFKDQLFTPNKLNVPENDQNQPASPEWRIENSDLGKMTLINSNLSACQLHFSSSKITDLFVVGTQMPYEITTSDPRQKQLGYSQIKKIYEARGDRVEANRYYAREMEAYQTTLSWRRWDDFWEKLNLSLNKYSTNYGQSWQRGIGTTLLISALFYTLYCWFLGYSPVWPTDKSFSLFSHLASYFLEFLNPIHKADYVAEQLLPKQAHISGWARTTEGVSRIFIAYFVYQLIQAFRKHGKASG